MSIARAMLTSAAGPGIVVVIVFALLLVFDPLSSAALLGSGVGSMANPLALVIVIVGLVVARRWYGALGFTVAAVLAARLLWVNRLDGFSWGREAVVATGIGMVALFAIALGYAARTVARRSRSARI